MLNITVTFQETVVQNTTTLEDNQINVTVLQKDGVDGKSVEFDIQGNTIGLKKEGDPNFTYTPDLKGEQGIQGIQGIQGEKGDMAIQGEYISYATLADAQAVNPKPSDGTLFQVEEEVNKGVYTFQSSEAGGTRFENNLTGQLEENIVSSSNLLDYNGLQDGFLLSSTGGLTSSANYQTSDFISVDGSTIYYGSIKDTGTGNVFRRHAFYDVNKTFISSNLNWVTEFTTPSNAKYVKISTYSESFNTLYKPENIGLFLTLDIWEDYFTPYTSLSLTNPSGEAPNSIVTRKDLPSRDNQLKVQLSETEKSYLESLVEGKVLKQFIRPFEAGQVFDFENVNYDGVLVKNGNDEAAPYRIDDTTLGANHGNWQNRTINFFVDGVEIQDYNNTYFASKNFTVKESYEILGSITTGVIAKVSMSYEFDKDGGCTIYTDFLAVQNNVNINNIMFTQAVCMEGTVNYYIPKTIPFVQDSVNYDFSSPYDMTNFAPANTFMIDLSRCEPTGILPDRLIMLRSDIGFAHGYLQIQDSEITRRREVIEQFALEIRNDTKKSYPNCIDVVNGSKTLSDGEYYSTIAYRKYFIPQKSTTASYIIRSNAGIYVYLDWHTTISERIDFPSDLSGKPFSLVEKSDSVTILSKENTGSMFFDVVGKGFAILKF